MIKTLYRILFSVIWELPCVFGEGSEVVFRRLLYGWEFSVFFLLHWLPPKTCEPSLSFFFICIKKRRFRAKDICVKVNSNKTNPELMAYDITSSIKLEIKSITITRQV